MKVLPEYFDPNQFKTPETTQHFIIKRPYTTFSNSMQLDFQEYYVGLLLFIINLLLL